MIPKHVTRALPAAASAGTCLFTAGPDAMADQPTAEPSTTATDNSNFTRLPYPGGGNRNDKVDNFQVFRSCTAYA